MSDTSKELRDRFEAALNERFAAKNGPLDDVVRQSHHATADLAHSVYGPESERLQISNRALNTAAIEALERAEKAEAERDDAQQVLAEEITAVGEERIATRRVDVLEVIRERDALQLALNGANAMKRVHKRRADLLRKRLDHATAALAGDSEGIRLFMVDHEQRVERVKEQARLAGIDADNNEAELNRIVTEIEAERDKTRDAEGATLRDENVINGIVNGLGIALKIARGER